jgi:hypothetical protein
LLSPYHNSRGNKINDHMPAGFLDNAGDGVAVLLPLIIGTG